jgi:dCTP deaminase
MSVLSDREIIERGIVTDAVQFQVARVNDRRVISFGVSSYGYDIRVAEQVQLVHKHVFGACLHERVSEGRSQYECIDSDVIDPKHALTMENAVSDLVVERDEDTGAKYVILPPHSFALAHSVEHLAIPRDVVTLCVGKSTYARCGLIVNVTPLEPEWRGQITLEISNTTPRPVRLYVEEGIAQLIFLAADSVCITSYADKNGKYQDQRGIVMPRA